MHMPMPMPMHMHMLHATCHMHMHMHMQTTESLPPWFARREALCRCTSGGCQVREGTQSQGGRVHEPRVHEPRLAATSGPSGAPGCVCVFMAKWGSLEYSPRGNCRVREGTQSQGGHTSVSLTPCGHLGACECEGSVRRWIPPEWSTRGESRMCVSSWRSGAHWNTRLCSSSLRACAHTGRLWRMDHTQC